MPPDAAPIDGTKVRLLTLADLDRRTTAARRARELIEAVHGDLGGTDRLATGERQIVQRAVILGVMAEDVESRWLMGEAVDPTILATMANAQRRLFETVGLKRVPRDVTPSLSEYLASKERG
jgi:hypothetical protein